MSNKTKDIEMMKETLRVCKQGFYEVDGEKKKLKLTAVQMEKADVFLPADIEKMKDNTLIGHEMPEVSCANMDSFSMARRLEGEHLSDKHVLVLNFANSIHPGGGVRSGAHAQEEDLCRKSSLLLSLESRAARKYYNYNKSLRTKMASDAVMITPEVEIIRDERGHFLSDSVIVSVMTCAAPDLGEKARSLSKEAYRKLVNDPAYQKLFYDRIVSMLRVAASQGYEALVLGAFGCGAFKNEPKIVSSLFYQAIKNFSYHGRSSRQIFKNISFAVLDNARNDYQNLNAFNRYFGGE